MPAAEFEPSVLRAFVFDFVHALSIGVSGSVTVKTAPPPRRLSAVISPPSTCTRFVRWRGRGRCRRGGRGICRRDRSARTRASRSSSGIPGPVSATVDGSWPSPMSAITSIDAAVGRVVDGVLDRGCGGCRAAWPHRPTSVRRRARPPRSAAAAFSCARRSKSAARLVIRALDVAGERTPASSCPASRRASRSRSLTSRSMRVEWRWMISRNLRLASSSSTSSMSASA